MLIKRAIKDIKEFYNEYKRAIKIAGGTMAAILTLVTVTPFKFSQFGDHLWTHRVLVYGLSTYFIIRLVHFQHLKNWEKTIRTLVTMIIIIVLGDQFHNFDTNTRLMAIEKELGIRESVNHNKYGLAGE